MTPEDLEAYWQIGRDYRFMALTADDVAALTVDMPEDEAEQVWIGYVWAVWKGLFQRNPSYRDMREVVDGVRAVLDGH